MENKPYFKAKDLAELLSGENSCAWKLWFKSRNKRYAKQEREDGDNLADWEVKHTALLNDLKAEYRPVCEQIFIEGQTDWRMVGKTADVGGKMDLVTFSPNLVIDAKTGKVKSAHVVQVQIYLWAIGFGLGKGKGEFSGLVRYPDSHEVKVTPPSEQFKTELGKLIGRLINEPDAVPSKWECKFCDIKDCTVRFQTEQVFEVAEF